MLWSQAVQSCVVRKGCVWSQARQGFTWPVPQQVPGTSVYLAASLVFDIPRQAKYHTGRLRENYGYGCSTSSI